MRQSSSDETHTAKCAAVIFGVCLACNGATAQDAALTWQVVNPPLAFSYEDLPPSYLQNGRVAQWNLAQEFSRGGANPAGPWAIGHALNRFGPFTLSSNWGVTLPLTWGWFSSSLGTLPTVAQPLIPSVYPDLGTGVSLPGGAVGLMPDNLGRFAVVKWTAPEPGQYAIDAQFTGRSTLETGNSDIAVFRNGFQLFYSLVRDPRQIVLMRTTLDLAAGETLDFRVGKSSDSNLNDLKQLDVVIQRLPRLCPGDINGDGFVNTADLTVLISQFGQHVIPSEGGDLNGDGVVDLNDLSLLLGNIGCIV